MSDYTILFSCSLRSHSDDRRAINLCGRRHLIRTAQLGVIQGQAEIRTGATCSDGTWPHLRPRFVIDHIRQKLESLNIAGSHWTSRVTSNSWTGTIHLLLAQANQPTDTTIIISRAAPTAGMRLLTSLPNPSFPHRLSLPFHHLRHSDQYFIIAPIQESSTLLILYGTSRPKSS